MVGEAIDFALKALGSSHTGRYTPDQIDYYDLSDVFRFALRRDLRRMFPPEGEVNYAGIGVASAEIDGHRFITDVYDGGPAKAAGVLAGDEVMAVDGQPFAEIGSFQGKAGQTVTLSVRHTADAAPVDIPVRVAAIQPTETYLKAISGSIATTRHRRPPHRLHPPVDVHQRSGHRHPLRRAVDGRAQQHRRAGPRSQEPLGRRAGRCGRDVRRRGRRHGSDRTGRQVAISITYRWHKPVVAIIDEGTRSGMEVLAYGLNKNGVPLVGSPTAGNVVAATAFLLPDSSLLELGVDDVKVDGKRIEGNPIQPDIAVPFDVRYADGRDPQRDAAVAVMVQRLGGAAAD